MKQLTYSVLKSPLFWLLTFLVGYGVFKTVDRNEIGSVIRSDGRGYYAYLPAFFIYHDGTFQQSSAAERAVGGENVDQFYLFKNRDGEVYNKYFPGVSVLQLPFFLLGCLLSWLFQQPIDGYNDVFLWCFYLGSCVYSLLGIYLFIRLLKLLFPEYFSLLRWKMVAIILSGPLAYYLFYTPSYSHLYSFFLFALAAYLLVNYQQKPLRRYWYWLGFIIGLIFLVRPTNLLVLLFFPALFPSKEAFLQFLRTIFRTQRSRTLIFSGIFLLTISLLFLTWKWETGEWVVWSYSGEGFDFLNPNWWQALFSFRIGLLVHIPLLLLVFGVAFYYRNQFGFQLFWWLLYVFVFVWITASWWCWDFESPFSIRPATEHFLFLVFPLFYIHRTLFKRLLIPMVCLTLMGSIRLYEKNTDFMSDQRFTSANYLSSLAWWKEENSGRWNFTLSCPPHGHLIRTLEWRQLAELPVVQPTDEYLCTHVFPLTHSSPEERMYYEVELEKYLSGNAMKDIYLVVDASAGVGRHYYKTVPLFNDLLEGHDSWKQLIFQGMIHDNFQEFTEVKIYIWNAGHCSFRLRNIRMRVGIYGQDAK